tara:strand:- start:5732 stop:6133 length:402 start_codon:yes stop_codon:yes gene_type:complete
MPTEKEKRLRKNILDVVQTNKEREEGLRLYPDGWEIMKPEHFIRMGFDKELVELLTSRQYSGEGKYGLTDNDGNQVDYIDGVYYLDLLETCARIVDPEYFCDKMGRGYRAAAALDCLMKAAKEATSKKVVANG